jgi:hypothetical protein
MMRTCSRAPARPRLHDVPDLAADHGDQQQRREGVEGQYRDDDLVRRHHGREAGEHREGHGSREQCQADRERADQAKRELGRRAPSKFRTRKVVGTCHWARVWSAAKIDRYP